MDTKIDAVGEISVVRVNGNILQENVQVFKKALLDLVDQGKIKIVLDLSLSIYLSSLCLATIVDIRMRVNEVGGDLKLAGITRLAQTVLESTNLTTKFETFSDVDAAVKSFGSSEK
jgi:anti-anti-sigma factor